MIFSRRARNITRVVLDEWIELRNAEIEPEMELDSFDVMVQLVELGLGVAFVPRRTLSAFRRGKGIHRVEVGAAPTREIGVFTRKQPQPSEEVDRFVEGILFS